MNLLEPTHLLILGLVILLFFGGKKIPELMRGLGQGYGELQKGLNDAKTKLTLTDQEPVQPNPAVEASKSTPVQSTTVETHV